MTQDVFIAMMQSIGSYTPWRKFDSWLFTIAHNKCMDYFRFRQKIVQVEDTMFDRPDPAASLEDMAAVSPVRKSRAGEAACRTAGGSDLTLFPPIYRKARSRE